MKKQFVLTGLLMVVLSLSGCMSMNSSFDCPNKAGTSCKSLDQINGMVDTGQIHGSNDVSKDVVNVNVPEFEGFPSLNTYAPGQPLRYGETVQRIWVAPYEDTDGNYHQDNVMYAVVKGGHWIGRPVKSIQAV